MNNQYIFNRRLKRKSQVTLFIILGLVILLFGAVIFLNYDIEEIGFEDETIRDPTLAYPINSYVESCLAGVVEKSILFIDFQGGYYAVPNPIGYISFKIPYYFYIGNESIPDKEQIEREFSKYIEEEMLVCINDFRLFKEIGYSFEVKDPIIKIRLGESIIVNMKYPIKVTKQQTMVELEDFIYTKIFDFDRLYHIIVQFAEEHQKNPDFVPIGYLSVVAHENNFTYDLTYFSNNSVIYSLIFTDLLKDNQSVLFNFAARYNWSEIAFVGEKVVIEPIPVQQVYPGYEVGYLVKAHGNNLSFSDYTSLFDINETSGEIRFRPKVRDVGIHYIIIKAQDNEGNEDTAILTLEVVGDNHAPVLEGISDVQIRVGEEFTYIANATDADGDTLFYNVETSLDNFEIHPTSGRMSFTPQLGQEGDYTIIVTAVDVKSEYDKKSFDMGIRNE